MESPADFVLSASVHRCAPGRTSPARDDPKVCDPHAPAPALCADARGTAAPRAPPQDACGTGSLTSRSDGGVAATRPQAPPGVGYDWPRPSARPRTPGQAVSSGWARECGPSVWPPQHLVPKEGQLRATGVGNGAHGSRGMRKDRGQLAERLLQARTGRRRPGMGRGLAKAGGHGRTWEPSRP